MAQGHAGVARRRNARRELAEEVSIPFVDRQPGLVARYAGRRLGWSGEEHLVERVVAVAEELSTGVTS